MAEEVDKITEGREQINAIVALDPAGNWPLLSGHNHTVIDFKKFTRNSIALEGSWIAGSNALAGTADVSFKIHSPETFTTQISTEHGLPPAVFAATLDQGLQCPGAIAEHLSLKRIMTPADRNENESRYLMNAHDEIFEGIIDISVEMKPQNDGSGTYPTAEPTHFWFKTPDGKQIVILLNKQETSGGGHENILTGEGGILVNGADGSTRIISNDCLDQ